MLRVLSAALLLGGAVPPCSHQATKPVQADAPGLRESLRSENPRREIDRYTELMSEHCAGVCVLRPTYPPVIVGSLTEGRLFNRAPIPVPPSPEGWAYEQQRLNR